MHTYEVWSKNNRYFQISLVTYILSRSSDIEFFPGPFTKCRINAFNSNFIKVVSKSLSKSNALFAFLRKFSRVKYVARLFSICLRSYLYKLLARLQLFTLISFRINVNATWIHTYIHYIYIIGHYNPSARIIELVSHTTYVMCVNFIHKLRGLQF